MTPLEFLTTINKYHFVTFVVLVFLIFGLWEMVEMKWSERNETRL